MKPKRAFLGNVPIKVSSPRFQCCILIGIYCMSLILYCSLVVLQLYPFQLWYQYTWKTVYLWKCTAMQKNREKSSCGMMDVSWKVEEEVHFYHSMGSIFWLILWQAKLCIEEADLNPLYLFSPVFCSRYMVLYTCIPVPFWKYNPNIVQMTSATSVLYSMLCFFT